MNSYRIFKVLLVSFTIFWSVCAFATTKDSKSVEPSGRLSVAATDIFIEPLKDVLWNYYKNHPEVLLTLKTGDAKALEDLVINKKDYDIFIGASQAAAFEYRQNKYIRNNYLFATEQLALYAPYEKVQDIDILTLQTGKISILNPDNFAIGKAALQALQALNMYDKVKDRIIFANSLDEQLQNLKNRVADAGFFPYSYLHKKQIFDTMEVWIVPKGTYEFIGYSVMINSKADAGAEKLVEDLIKLTAKRAVAKYGFADITTLDAKKRPPKINVQDYYPTGKKSNKAIISVPIHK